MSGTLYLTPRPVLSKISLPFNAKLILAKKYDIKNGATLTETDYAYLSALRDAEIEGIAEILEAINKHGCVLIKEEF